MDFPNDADGDALRRVAERSDMSKPMDIDFAVDVPSKKSGEEVQRLAAQRGFRPILYFDETDQRWTCYCSNRMVPTYEPIIAAQKELDELIAPFDGYSGGVGTPGN